MSQPSGEPAEPKRDIRTESKKSKVSKSTKGQDSKSKVKIAAYISLESARRLGIHATMTGKDRSAIIDALIKEHLRDWVVQYRPSAKGAEEQVEEPEAQAG